MNEFLINFSSDHTFLWALLIIGSIGGSAIVLHLFWTGVFQVIDFLRGNRSNDAGGGH